LEGNKIVLTKGYREGLLHSKSKWVWYLGFWKQTWFWTDSSQMSCVCVWKLSEYSAEGIGDRIGQTVLRLFQE